MLDGVIITVHRIQEHCSVFNWDGLGAKPVSPEAVRLALKFLHGLSKDWRSPEPEVAPKTDGSINITWDMPCGDTFVGTFSTDGEDFRMYPCSET